MRKVRADLVGKVFGRLKVISYSQTKNGGAYWNLVCTCGNTKECSTGSLTSGNTKSCGCLRREIVSKAMTKHGDKGTKLHYRWAAMRSRCRGTDPRYKRLYTDRGIKVCDEWNDYSVFKQDMGSTYKEGLELDRIDNNGDYCKENCRWATRKEQVANRRGCRQFVIDGQKWTLKKYCSQNHLNYKQHKLLFDSGLFPSSTNRRH